MMNKRILISCFIFLLTSSSAFAQMFSVKKKSKEIIENSSSIEFRLGTNLTKFKYNGGLLTGNQQAIFNFNDPIYFIEGTFGNVKLHLDYGNSLGKTESLRFVNFALTFLGDYTLYRSRIVDVSIPIQIISDSFTISSQDFFESLSSRYEQAGFTFGTGIQTRFTTIPGTNLILSQTAHYGFAARGFGGVYGSKSLFESKAQFITGRIFSDCRLTLNFSYNYHDYDLDGQIYDYELSGFTFGLGLTF